MSSGTTFLRESASYVFATCPLTKLKNQRWPIHITPARTWIQRKMRFSHSLKFDDSIRPPRGKSACGAHTTVPGSLRRVRSDEGGKRSRQPRVRVRIFGPMKRYEAKQFPRLKG